MKTNFIRRTWVIYYFLKACFLHRVFPLKYFAIHLDHLKDDENIYSKQNINSQIPSHWQLKSIMIPFKEKVDTSLKRIENEFHYPLFLKPEWGENSLGVHRISDPETLLSVLQKIKKTGQNYICQEAAQGTQEYDFFFIKSPDMTLQEKAFSCIQMDSPCLRGNGKSSLVELLHEQYPNQKSLFSDYKPTDVLPKNKILRLSYINGVNHGTTYHNLTSQLSSEDKKALWKHLSQLGNFQFGRIGISAHNLKSIIASDFKVIEINIFTPFPLDLLDPNISTINQRKQLEQYMNILLTSIKHKKIITPQATLKVLRLLWETKKRIHSYQAVS